MKLSVRVHPRSSSTRVVMKDAGSCDVWVTEPPVDQRATEAVRDALSEFLGVAKSRVRLVRGGRSRIKVFEVV